ncbi:MAG: class I SAM-dependent methyltransferase [Patescibacteria group bacterium]
MDYNTQKNLLKIVKDSYDAIAEEFNRTREKHSEPLWSGLVKIAKKIKAGDKILDVGCGNGRLLKIIGDKDIQYLGVDNNEKLLSISKKKLPKYKFVLGDILELSKIPDINFNYIFCIALLHHLPGKDLRVAALKQLKNKVAPDGKIIITVWNLWTQVKFRQLILKFFFLKLIKKNLPAQAGKMDFGDILFDWKNSRGEVLSQRYYHAFIKIGLKKIAKKAGLKIEKIYKDRFNYYLILKK